MRILYLQESRILSSFIKSDLESNLGVLYATAQVGRRDDWLDDGRRRGKRHDWFV